MKFHVGGHVPEKYPGRYHLLATVQHHNRRAVWARGEAPLNMDGPAVMFRTCQYISGEPSFNDRCKCGAPTDGRTYCAAHWVLTRRREGSAVGT